MTKRIRRYHAAPPAKVTTPNDQPQYVGFACGSTMHTPGGKAGITVAIRDDNGALRTSWYVVPQASGDRMAEDFRAWVQNQGTHTEDGPQVTMTAALQWFGKRIRQERDRDRL